MRIVMFYHSLVSCWNHGNAHFLRGLVSELAARGHDVVVYEPSDGWSRTNLVREHGEAALADLTAALPNLQSHGYDSKSLELDRVLDGADLVLVHEWNEHDLVARIGAHRRVSRYKLLFHDTHHRAVTDPAAMARYELRDYDGVLAFGEVIRELYLRQGWTARAWTFHEAADVRRFHPLGGENELGELVWVGNWGDGERDAELAEFLLEPVRALALRASIYGVRYPDHALGALQRAGATYRGWLPNHRVPRTFAAHRVTVHVPRRPYVEALPGIPTIRPFEAMACGIPLISSPWDDCEGLFSAGHDYLVARDGVEMQRQLRAVLHDSALASSLAEHGRRTILTRHTCGHRADELLAIYAQLDAPAKAAASA